MPPSTLRASDLSTFEFCHRAWHYARLNTPHQYPEQLQQGTTWHDDVEQRSRLSVALLRIGVYLATLGFAIAVAGFLFR